MAKLGSGEAKGAETAEESSGEEGGELGVWEQ